MRLWWVGADFYTDFNSDCIIYFPPWSHQNLLSFVFLRTLGCEREGVISPWYSFDTFARNSVCLVVCLSLGTVFYDTGLCVCFVANTMSLKWNLKLAILISPALLFCLGFALTLWILFAFTCISALAFLVLWRMPLEFDGIALKL